MISINDEKLINKLAELELEHWDFAIDLVLREVNKVMKKGLTMEQIIFYLNHEWPTTKQHLDQMSERGQKFHKDHARKVLKLIKDNSK